MSERYCLIYDDDGHLWLCPVELRDEGKRLITECEAYWAGGGIGKAPPDPDSTDWLKRVDNPGRLTFSEPREDL